jgi:hypothetical protein
MWEDGTSPITTQSRTIGLVQLVDTEGFLFSGYSTERCTVFDLFGGVYELENLVTWRTENLNQIASITFSFFNRQFQIQAVLLNKDHELANWNSGTGPPAVDCGCAFCFLPRTLYSVFPMTGHVRSLSEALRAFGQMKV